MYAILTAALVFTATPKIIHQTETPNVAQTEKFASAKELKEATTRVIAAMKKDGHKVVLDGIYFTEGPKVAFVAMTTDGVKNGLLFMSIDGIWSMAPVNFVAD